MDMKKTALPAAIGLALGIGGGAAIPKSVEVTPKAAIQVLETATEQDFVDTALCQQRLKLVQKRSNMLSRSNRKLAEMIEKSQDVVEMERITKELADGCATAIAEIQASLAACEAKYENAIHPTTGPRRAAPPTDD